MTEAKEKKKEQKKPVSDRLLQVLSRFIVSLTWAILLAVVIFVVYLATQFAQG